MAVVSWKAASSSVLVPLLLVALALVMAAVVVEARQDDANELQQIAANNVGTLSPGLGSAVVATINNTIANSFIWFSCSAVLDPAEQAPGAGAIQVSYTSLASGKPTPIFSVVYSITNVSNVWTDSYSTCSTIVTQTVDSESTAVGNKVGIWNVTFLSLSSNPSTYQANCTIGSTAGTLSVNQTVSLLVATTVTYYSFTLPSESDFYNVSITASDLDTGDASWLTAATYTQGGCPLYDTDGKPQNNKNQNTIEPSAPGTFTATLKKGVWNIALVGDASEHSVSLTLIAEPTKIASWSTTTIISVSVTVGVVVLLFGAVLLGAIIFYLKRRKEYELL